jgi:MFS transporter, DHA2 family, multidrug resistance protein
MRAEAASAAELRPPESGGHPRRWLILGVLVVSLLVVVLDNTVLNVAMRTIADPVHGLGASQAELEWSINSYTLVFAGLLFTFGVLGDRVGRRRILLIGLALFAVSSLASAYAQTPAQLIWARAAMGIGGAAVMPSTLSIISNIFEPRERGKAIGVWAGSVGLAVAIGPVTGGALLERFWWGSVFLINVPIIVLGLVAVIAIVPESRDPRPGRLDLIGVTTSIAGLVALVYGIIDAGEHGFGHPRTGIAIVLGLAILAFFIWYERRTDHPSLDVTLFRDPRFSAAVGSVGLLFFAAMGTMFFLAFYLQLVRGFSPLMAGVLMTPFAAAQLMFAPRSAAMVTRFGPKLVCAVGLGLVTVSLFAYVFIGATTPVWVLCVFTFVQGVGMALVMPPATESIMSSLPREKAGVGSAVSNTVRQVGGSLGVAVLGALLSAIYRSEVSPSLDGLPPSARAVAGESLAGAHAVADALGPGAAGAALSAADEAFVVAMHWASGLSAVVALVSIVVVAVWLPSRAEPHHAPGDGSAPSDDGASDGGASGGGLSDGGASGGGPGDGRGRPADAGRPGDAVLVDGR